MIDHRRRQADPHAGRRHPHHRPQHPGRAPDPPRGGTRRWWRWSAWPRRKRAEREVAPEVAAARAEQQAEPLAGGGSGRGGDRRGRERGATTTRRGRRGRRTTTAATRRRQAIDEHSAGERTPDGHEPAVNERPALAPALFERASQLFPGRRELAGARLQGGGRHAGVPRPRRQGAHVWDVDGNRYLDFVGSWGPLILGHADPDVVAAIVHAAAAAPPSAPPPRARSSSASESAWRCPSMEKMRFVSSGTEATMSALRAGARLHRAAPRSSRSTAATTATPTRCWRRPARAPSRWASRARPA